jgi:hypothetical protein
MPYAYRKSDSPQQSKDGDLQDTYIVRDVQDASQAIAVAHGAAPLTIGVRIKEAIPDARPVGYDTFEVTFSYVDPELEGVGDENRPPDENTPSLPLLELDIASGGTQHITQAINQWHIPDNISSRQNAIGASRSTDKGWQVEGTEIRLPSFSFSLHVDWPVQAIVNAGGGQYIFNLYRGCTKVNDAPWTARAYFRGSVIDLPFEKHEVQFLGVRGGGNGIHFPLTYFFEASPNVELTYSSIGQNKLQKHGFDYVWVEYEAEEKTDEQKRKEIIAKPFAAFASQVYYDTNFQTLLGF